MLNDGIFQCGANASDERSAAVAYITAEKMLNSMKPNANFRFTRKLRHLRRFCSTLMRYACATRHLLKANDD